MRNVLLFYYVAGVYVIMIIIIIINSLTRSLYIIWTNLSPFPVQLWLIFYHGSYTCHVFIPVKITVQCFLKVRTTEKWTSVLKMWIRTSLKCTALKLTTLKWKLAIMSVLCSGIIKWLSSSCRSNICLLSSSVVPHTLSQMCLCFSFFRSAGCIDSRQSRILKYLMFDNAGIVNSYCKRTANFDKNFGKHCLWIPWSHYVILR